MSMKGILVFVVFCVFSSCVFANIPARKYENMPQGTFKKSINGTINQYDKRGKKIGIYKIKNGKYVKVK